MFIIYISLTIVGTTGNSLILLTTKHKEFNKSSSFVFLSVLAISDLFVVFFGLLTTKVLESDFWFGFNLRNYSLSWCMTLEYMIESSSKISSWCIAGITLERAVAVVLPHRYGSQTSNVVWHQRAVLPKACVVCLVACNMQKVSFVSLHHIFFCCRVVFRHRQYFQFLIELPLQKNTKPQPGFWLVSVPGIGLLGQCLKEIVSLSFGGRPFLWTQVTLHYFCSTGQSCWWPEEMQGL